MCTALSFTTDHHYFGRNLDLDYSYNEAVTITPRNYPFTFRNVSDSHKGYAIIGMAYVTENYPLYYDATNEAGLSMAGLNFPQNAFYEPHLHPGTYNIAPFELIPWILRNCENVTCAEALLKETTLVRQHFSQELPLTPLHWILSDKERSVVIEPMGEGIVLCNNPVGILTNNPPFPYHMQHLSHYMQLTRNEPENHFAPALKLSPYSRGMGAMGLPGDLSSASRFIRAVFVKENAICGHTEAESINQFFHILTAVEQQRGCVLTENGHFELTIYSSCCNTDKGIYYYTTYENRRITAINMHHTDLDAAELTSYPLINTADIRYLN